MVPTCGTAGAHSRRMLKQARLLTRPTLARRDAPCPKQGRSSEADTRFTFHASRFDKLTVPSQVEGRFTVLGSDARTLLADCFSILLERPLLSRPLIPQDRAC
jgi:hypothetical protein